MNVFDISAKIGLDMSEYVNGLSEASKDASSFGDLMKNSFSSAMQIGAKAIGAVASETINFSKSLVDSVGELASLGDHIDKQSQKMNMSAQAYQEWDAIMQHSGTSIDSMQASMKTLANAAESDNDAFTALGMNLEEVKKMSSEELFAKTITALQNVESDTQRTYLASQLLGRGATELGALLNTSAEDTEKMRQRVHELGGVMSDEAVKASAKYQDSLQDMKTAMSGVTRGIKSEFLPSFTDIMDGLTSIFAGEEGGEKTLSRGISNAFTTLSNSAKKIRPIIEKFGTIAFETIEKNLPSIIRRTVGLVGRIATGVIESLPEILTSAGGVLETVGDSILEFLPDWLSSDIKSIFGTVKDFIGGIDFDTLRDKFSSLGESLAAFGEKLSGGIAWAFENVLKPLGTWLMNDALPVALDVFRGALDNISNVVTILAPIGEKLWTNFFSPLFSGIGELSTGTLMMLGNALNGIAETFKGFDTEGFIKDMKNGNLFDNWKDGMTDIVNSIDLFGEKVDDFFSANGAAEMWNRVWQTIGGAIFDAKEKIVQSIKDIIQGIDDLINKITSLPNKWTDFWSGFGEYLASSPEERNMIDSNADGGYVSTPRLSWVGEKEPEYIIPESKMDKVYKNGSPVNITINVEGGISSDYDVERIAQKLSELSVLQTRAIGGTGY